MPTNKEFRGSGSHRQVFRRYWDLPAWHSGSVNERGKPASQQSVTAEMSAKQSIKRQLQATHVAAVGWERHSSSTTTCAGKVDHEITSKSKQGAHIHQPCLVPVRRLFRPSRSMHFGDVSETNGRETPRQSRSAHAWAVLHFWKVHTVKSINNFAREYPSLQDRHYWHYCKNN